MNILFISHYSELYGANRSLINLLEGLIEYNINPLVVIPEHGEIVQVLKVKRIPFVIQQFHRWCTIDEEKPINSIRKFIFLIKKKKIYKEQVQDNLIFVESLKKRIGDFKPDFIYSNSSVFNFGLLYAKKNSTPHIWHLRESQEQYNLSWSSSKSKVKEDFMSSEIIIAVSDYLKRKYENELGLKNIFVLYNGVLSKADLVKLDQLRWEKKTEQFGVTFGILGVINPMKNQIEAIKALDIVVRKYPSTRLIIAGKGDQTSLRNLIDKLGISSNVEILGHISDPFQVFLELDVYLMCSKSEGFGRVTVEAMASNLPVIGYKDGGTLEIIQDKVNGLFYEGGYEFLADKMIYLIDFKNERKRLGDNGREVFEKKYTIEKYAFNFYNILLNNNRTYNGNKSGTIENIE